MSILLSVYNHWYMWYLTVHKPCSVIPLAHGAQSAVDRCIHAPKSCTLMLPSLAHAVFIFGPMTCWQPQHRVAGCLYGIGLTVISATVLAEHLCYACCHSVGTIVIGCGMCHCTSTVIECIAGPDAAIGIIEMVAIRIKISFLPCQVRFYHWPHSAHICSVGII